MLYDTPLSEDVLPVKRVGAVIPQGDLYTTTTTDGFTYGNEGATYGATPVAYSTGNTGKNNNASNLPDAPNPYLIPIAVGAVALLGLYFFMK